MGAIVLARLYLASVKSALQQIAIFGHTPAKPAQRSARILLCIGARQSGGPATW